MVRYHSTTVPNHKVYVVKVRGGCDYAKCHSNAVVFGKSPVIEFIFPCRGNGRGGGIQPLDNNIHFG